MHTAMTSIRLPKIGTVSRRGDDAYDVGPIPGLGGPFETAKEFFVAWADNIRFPLGEQAIRCQLAQSPADMVEDLILSIRGFPLLFKQALSKMSLRQGPFPLHHPDFNHSNVIIDDAYNILSIIDWDGAFMVPWEMVEFPMFLYTVPPPVDLPSKYDSAGNPVSVETRRRWEEHQHYVELVKRAEDQRGIDDRLSTTLASRDMQNLATSLKLYADVGKLGYYSKLLENLQNN